MRDIHSFFDKKRQKEVLGAARAGKPIPPRPKAMPLAEGTSSPENLEALNARLLEACVRRDVERVGEALEKGADANMRDEQGRTALARVGYEITNVQQWTIMFDLKRFKSEDGMQEEALRALREIQELLRKHGGME